MTAPLDLWSSTWVSQVKDSTYDIVTSKDFMKARRSDRHLAGRPVEAAYLSAAAREVPMNPCKWETNTAPRSKDHPIRAVDGPFSFNPGKSGKGASPTHVWSVIAEHQPLLLIRRAPSPHSHFLQLVIVQSTQRWGPNWRGNRALLTRNFILILWSRRQLSTHLHFWPTIVGHP